MTLTAPMNEADFAVRLAKTAVAIEHELDDLLAIEPKTGEPARPARLIEAMRYATLGGGKRLRAFLTVETARALGRADGGPRRAGAAIECVHAYSLIHDDLPAMRQTTICGAAAQQLTGPSTKPRRSWPATRCSAGLRSCADPATDPRTQKCAPRFA